MPRKRIVARPGEQRKADKLIVKVKKQTAAKREREDFSQAAARIVREATES
jgi:hypothetical protein